MAFDPSKFSTKAPKSIPVLLLLDVSGSMSESCGDGGESRPISKIEALHTALRDMIKGFKEAQNLETFIKLSIITFGASAELHTPLSPISDIKNIPSLHANGSTPLGEALSMAKAMIENKDIFKGGDYRPAVVLLSDGMPDSGWEAPLHAFISDGRSAKCDRLAIAFGRDADKDMLEQFIQGCANPLFYAEDAATLHKVFKKITMSVSTRITLQNKNESINIDAELDIDTELNKC